MRLHAAVVAVVAVLAAFALSACGGTTTTVITTQNNAATSTPTSTSSAQTPATTHVAPIPAARHCRAAQLALSFLGGQGATGHGELGFALRNIGAAGCRTFGYPGVLFLSQTGQPLPTLSTRTTHDFFGSTPVVALVVPPGGMISFRLGVTHGISSPVGCTTAYGLQVIPPDDTVALHTTITGGAYECRTATVSPVRPGTSAYQ